MSFLDKIVGAVTPPESDETRMNARARARAEATAGDWLSVVLDQHDAIEAAFAAVKAAPDSAGRRTAQKRLAVLLTGHSNAEEAVLYPEMADSGHKTHAGMAYEEQAMTKIQLALLEKLDPMSQDYLDKVDHIRGAVTHHMYQEESDWFLELKSQVPAERQAALAARFQEEIDRYAGADAA
jgi:hemerythrin superfamily protein